VPGTVSNIQLGVQTVESGDTISVRRGSYFGSGFRDVQFDGTHVVLIAEDGPDLTILNCQGTEDSEHRAFTMVDGTPTAIEIQGFTIRTGYAKNGGAAICMNGFASTFRNCIFEFNSANLNGGVVFIRDASASFIDCEFRDNYAGGYTTGGAGAGAVEVYDGAVSFLRCKFVGNTAGSKRGAINAERSELWITDCEFTENDGYGSYGQLDNKLGAVGIGNQSEAWISDCLFKDNLGFAIGVSRSTLHLVGSTIADNCGGISTWYSTCDIQKTIIARNYQHESILGTGWNRYQIACSNFWANGGGNWTGSFAQLEFTDGNFSADPRFCDPDNGDYHIHDLSPCSPLYSPCGERVGLLAVQCQSGYTCGDMSFNGVVDIDDAVYLLNYAFLGGLQPIPYESGDVDCNTYVDIDDIVYMIYYIFAEGPAPCAVCPQ